jgi:hypothetical protein
MTWNAYKIVFRVLTPMHMGQAKLGNLQRTRPYVHGKSLWGALTARLTRDDPGLGGDYAAVGSRVSDELAFSYFYPTTSHQVDLWPWDDPDQFAWRYLGSYASTALDYTLNSAEDGSLHETEYIAPTSREGEPVNLVGYVFEKAGCTLPWKDALTRLQLGGERTYGWGRVELRAIHSTTEEFFSRLPMTLDGARPGLRLNQEAVLIAHASANGENAIKAHGSLVPLVGRETRSAANHGRYLSPPMICWEPGSQVDAETPAIVSNYGIWEAVV